MREVDFLPCPIHSTLFSMMTPEDTSWKFGDLMKISKTPRNTVLKTTNLREEK